MILDFELSDFLTSAALYIFMALFIGMSQAAGLGGGPILNITLMLGFGYTTKQSMAITYIFLLGGTVASMYSNFGKRNKSNTKNLIDENLIILTLPMTVSGSVIGSMLNHFISELIVTICFAILLVMLAKNSLDKFKQSVKKGQKKEPTTEVPLLVENQLRPMPIEEDDSERESRMTRQTLKEMKPELKQIVSQELIPMRFENLSIYFQILTICLLAMLIKGGTTFDSIIGIPKCSWMSQVVVVILLIIAFRYAKYIFKKQYRSDIRKEQLGFVFKKEQDKMSLKYFNNSLFVGFFAGCIGGMLGIGGSIILIPVWLDSGIDKDIATSSTAPLIFTSAFISMFIALLCNMYGSFIEVILYFIMAFCASYYVKKMVNWIKEKYKMEGLVFLLLFILMLASIIFLIPYEINKMIKFPHKFFSFGEFC